MVALGLMYSSGRGGLQRNDAEAVRLFRQAADKGNAAGMFHLGLAYARGQGVAHDDAESDRWYRKAADAGDVAAMHNLGDVYDKGRGVPKNARLAAEWVFKALSRGAAFSINQMANNPNGYSDAFRRELQRLLTQAGVYDGATRRPLRAIDQGRDRGACQKGRSIAMSDMLRSSRFCERRAAVFALSIPVD